VNSSRPTPSNYFFVKVFVVIRGYDLVVRVYSHLPSFPGKNPEKASYKCAVQRPKTEMKNRRLARHGPLSLLPVRGGKGESVRRRKTVKRYLSEIFAGGFGAGGATGGGMRAWDWARTKISKWRVKVRPAVRSWRTVKNMHVIRVHLFIRPPRCNRMKAGG
jgi:hypothetical protein